MRDYYAVLEVDADATAVQSRRASERRARRYSPDVNFWEREARALFEEIAEAYRIVSDPATGTVYDRQGARPAGSGGAGTTEGGGGDDVDIPVELSFQQAVAGVEVDVPIDRLSPCAGCGATGAAPGAEPSVCSHCGGLGTVWREASGQGVRCPACDGAGTRGSEPCAACRGPGVSPSRASIHGPLPPGLGTGRMLPAAGGRRGRGRGEVAGMREGGRPLDRMGGVAEMVKIDPQTLGMYEKKGLIRPSRTEGKTRMYSAEDVEEIARVTRLARDLGVNLAGIEIILKMRRRMLDMQARIEELTDHVRGDMADVRDEARRARGEALGRAASSQLSPVALF